METVVVGLGYVGAVVAAAVAHAGHRVLGMDVDQERIADLRGVRRLDGEPDLDRLVKQGLDSGLLRFAHVSEVGTLRPELIVVAVGTPALPSGDVDLSQVRGSLQWARSHVASPATVMMKSTVPPGNGLRLEHDELAGTGLHYVASPEFLREGEAVSDWFHPYRIVIGGENEEAVRQAKSLYQGIEAPILVTDVTTAEMIKYASNAFLATKVSFINEIANLCDRLGASIDEVAKGIGLDPRIGDKFLAAGLGYGGSCFPKDMRALEFLAINHSHYLPELLRAVVSVNNKQRLLPLAFLGETLGSLQGRRIALLGLTFKPGTDDVRDSPGMDLARLLRERGANVCAYDPMGMARARRVLPQDVAFCESARAALEGVQAVVIATEWEEFKHLDWEQAVHRMAPPRAIFDGRNILDPTRMRSLGYQFRGVGRGRARPQASH